MGAVSVFVVSLLLAILGIVIGFRVGQEWGVRAPTKRSYWTRNVIAYLVAIVISAFIAALGYVVLIFAIIGLLGGVIAGLKFGYGSEGPWKKLDSWMGVKNRHLATQKRPGNKEEPELISVQDPGTIPDRKSKRTQ